MATSAEKTVCGLAIEVSEDRMQACLRVIDTKAARSDVPETIIKALQESHIVVSDDVKAKVDEFVALVSSTAKITEPFVVAEGRAPVEGQDGTFVWHEDFQKMHKEWKEDDAVNYYSLNSIQTVEADQKIGTLVAPQAGVPGVDLTGKEVEPEHTPVPVQLDASVRREAGETKAVFANTAGRVEFKDGRVRVNELFKVGHDVDFETGNIDSTVDVLICGTIHDRFEVTSKKSITVGGAVEAAKIEADGEVVVRGGILQRGTGSIRCGGEVVARFCDEANIHAEGDVKITREIMNSRVHCGSKVLAEHGAVIGGSVYAREGVEVHSLGSDACVATQITVGVHPDVLFEADKLREGIGPKQEMADRIRSKIQPLMAELKRLSPQQRERVTELSFQADTLELDISDREERRDEMLAAAGPKGNPYVLVSNTINQGVSIRIGRRAVSFRQAIRGPVKIEERKIRNTTEFVAVNQLTASVKVLPAMVVEDPPPKKADAAAEKTPEEKVKAAD